jgi:hypothetical protein
MTGTFSVFNQPALILFDYGASHSFISQKFSARCQLPFCHTRGSFIIATLGGKVATNQSKRAYSTGKPYCQNHPPYFRIGKCGHYSRSQLDDPAPSGARYSQPHC